MADNNNQEEYNLGLQFEDIVPWGVTGGDTGLSSRLKIKRNFEKIRARFNADPGLFLSKLHDDIAQGVITFLKGIIIGDYAEGDSGGKITQNGDAELASVIARMFMQSPVIKSPDYTGEGLFDKGFGVFNQTEGNGANAHTYSHAVVDFLTVRLKAFFAQLELREISYVGGNYVFSSAGSKIYHVEYMDSENNVIDKMSGGIPHHFRCWFYSDDGTTATMNKWAVNDQAQCRTFDIDTGTHENVQSRFYWRLVKAVGKCAIPTLGPDDENYGKEFQYVDLSNVNSPTLEHALNSSGSTPDSNNPVIGEDYPEAGDKIVQIGNWTNPDRQGMMYLQVCGTLAFYMYEGVGTTHFEIPEATTRISPKLGNVFKGTFLSAAGGDNYDDTISGLVDRINDVEQQADKKFDFWYGDYSPMPQQPGDTPNYPANQWTTPALKSQHAQDIFTDTSREAAQDTSGRVWRYEAVQDDNDPNVIWYLWKEVTDRDTIAVKEQLTDVASDGKLSGGAEKGRVYTDWMRCVDEYNKYNVQRNLYSVNTEFTAYQTAFLELGKYLNGGTALTVDSQTGEYNIPLWISNDSTSGLLVTTDVTPATWNSKWNAYYTTITNLANAIRLAAKTQVDDLASDGIISAGAEKRQLLSEWLAAVVEHTALIDQATDYFGATCTNSGKEAYAYNQAYKNLAKMLNGGTTAGSTILDGSVYPSWLNADMEVDTVISSTPTVVTYLNRWKTYYEEAEKLAKAIAAKAKELADNAQGDATSALGLIADIASDAKLDPSEKVTLKREFNACWYEMKASGGILDRAKVNGSYIINEATYITPYINAFNAIGTMLNGGTSWTAPNISGSEKVISNSNLPSWLKEANMATTNDINSDTFREKWSTFYNTRTGVLTALTNHAESTGQNAQNTVDNLAADGIISAGYEKSVLYVEWLKAVAEYNKALSNGSGTSDLVSAFKDLAKMLNGGTAMSYNSDNTISTNARPSWISSANMQTDTVISSTPGVSTYQSKWSAFYTALADLNAKRLIYGVDAQFWNSGTSLVSRVTGTEATLYDHTENGVTVKGLTTITSEHTVSINGISSEITSSRGSYSSLNLRLNGIDTTVTNNKTAADNAFNTLNNTTIPGLSNRITTAQNTADGAASAASNAATWISQNKDRIALIAAQFDADGNLTNTSGLITTSNFSTLFAQAYDNKQKALNDPNGWTQGKWKVDSNTNAVVSDTSSTQIRYKNSIKVNSGTKFYLSPNYVLILYFVNSGGQYIGSTSQPGSLSGALSITIPSGADTANAQISSTVSGVTVSVSEVLSMGFMISNSNIVTTANLSLYVEDSISWITAEADKIIFNFTKQFKIKANNTEVLNLSTTGDLWLKGSIQAESGSVIGGTGNEGIRVVDGQLERYDADDAQWHPLFARREVSVINFTNSTTTSILSKADDFVMTNGNYDKTVKMPANARSGKIISIKNVGGTLKIKPNTGQDIRNNDQSLTEYSIGAYDRVELVYIPTTWWVNVMRNSIL